MVRLWIGPKLTFDHLFLSSRRLLCTRSPSPCWRVSLPIMMSVERSVMTCAVMWADSLPCWTLTWATPTTYSPPPPAPHRVSVDGVMVDFSSSGIRLYASSLIADLAAPVSMSADAATSPQCTSAISCADSLSCTLSASAMRSARSFLRPASVVAGGGWGRLSLVSSKGFDSSPSFFVTVLTGTFLPFASALDSGESFAGFVFVVGF